MSSAAEYEAERRAIAKRDDGEIRETTEISVGNVLHNLGLVEELMQRAMVLGVDYGAIPGTGGKPTLLKPGAEKLGKMFRLAAKPTTTKTYLPNGHLVVECNCSIYGPDDNFLGQSSRICTTMESKYRYRGGSRKCPDCGKAAIIKGKAEYGGGFICFKKKGGCGAKFGDADQRITSQSEEKIENPDLADSYNTVIAIAEKRAFVAAMRIVTASSALFDEEIPAVNEGSHDEPRHEEPPRQQRQAPQKPAEAIDQLAVDTWKGFMKSEPRLDEINARLPELKKLNVPTRSLIWASLESTLNAEQYVFDGETKKFVPAPVDDPGEKVKEPDEEPPPF